MNNQKRRKFIRNIAALPLASILFPRYGLGQTFSEKPDLPYRMVNNTVYGAKADAEGPIGGGAGYKHIVRKWDYVADSPESLIAALSQAKKGQVVFIPAQAVIDLTTFIYIDEFALEIPEGVTLAGDRGAEGSLGALICSDTLDTPVMIKAAGPDVRITGLRIQGPNPKTYREHHDRAFGPGGKGHEYYYKFPLSKGIETVHSGLTIDNCEVSAFSHSGIHLVRGVNHHVHHNKIFNCQYDGLGYGVCQGSEGPKYYAFSTIEFNLFDSNRHSIAGTGLPGCGYIARNNIQTGNSLSHCFDMHGGINRKDGTDIAGTRIEIYNNTFLSSEYALAILGEPEEHCKFYNNWVTMHASGQNAIYGHANARVQVFDNLYGKPRNTVK